MVFPRSYLVYSVNYFLTLSSGFPLRVGWLLTINPRLPCNYLLCTVLYLDKAVKPYMLTEVGMGIQVGTSG